MIRNIILVVIAYVIYRQYSVAKGGTILVVPPSHQSIQDKINYIMGYGYDFNNSRYSTELIDWFHDNCPGVEGTLRWIYDKALNWAREEPVGDHPTWVTVVDEGAEAFSWDIATTKILINRLLGERHGDCRSCFDEIFSASLKNFFKIVFA